MKSIRLALVASAALASAQLAAFDAEACGGCFTPPVTDTSFVSGHRMVMSVSPVQTVLWDQFEYVGEPEDFAWVLPVKAGARVEVGGDAFFETLETETVAVVQQPFVRCRQTPRTSCNDGSDSDGGGFSGSEDGGPSVDILHKGTVGPYETVTLSTDEEGALNQWLDDHGYNVDESSQPIIDAYVEEGFDFIALRLQPGQGVRAMTPVRVVTPGGDPTLPLRMVRIGAANEVSIVLYVVGEGRWEVENFPNTAIAVDLLSFDMIDNTSNYAELREAALAAEGGRGWVTTYAQMDTFFGPLSSANGVSGLTFADAYAEQAFDNGETDEQCLISHVGESMAVVTDPCPPDVASWDDPACGDTGANQIDRRNLGCEGMEDLAVALTGMHPADVWVTRMEAMLPVSAMDQDLRLRAAGSQEPVSNLLQARIAERAKEFCGAATPVLLPVDGPPPTPREVYLVVGSLGLLLMAGLYRRLSTRRAHGAASI